MSAEEKLPDQSNENSETLKQDKSQKQTKQKQTKQKQTKQKGGEDVSAPLPATQAEKGKKTWKLPKPEEEFFK